MVFTEAEAVEKVLNKEHNIDGKSVDAKKAIPHALHQVRDFS